MTYSLIKMAQQAGRSDRLIGSLIHAYSQQMGQSWPDIAAELGINPEQLARLALCSRPASGDDMAQIAQHVGLERRQLAQFIRRAERHSRHGRSAPARRRDQSSRLSRIPGRPFLAFGFAALVVLLLAAFAFAEPAGSDATLVVTSGEATLTQVTRRLLVVPEENRLGVAAGSSILVRQGDVIDLPADAAAQLRLNDGSSVDLAAGTTLELSEVLTDADSYQVRLGLVAGRTVSRVVRLLGQGNVFEIRTPSSTASVRGTVFAVEVFSDSETYVSVDEGIVFVTMGAEGVLVHPGEEVWAIVGQPLVVQPQNPDSPAAERPSQQVPGTSADTPTPPPPATSTPLDPTNTPAPLPTAADGPPTAVPTDPAPEQSGDDGPPAQVPGNPPADPPGQGDPPDGGGTPPGQGGGPPGQVPGNPPADPPGQGSPPGGGGTPPGQGGSPPGQGGGPPGQVPGNPPSDPPGQGNPPGGGGTPPGQGGTPPGQNRP